MEEILDQLIGCAALPEAQREAHNKTEELVRLQHEETAIRLRLEAQQQETMELNRRMVSSLIIDSFSGLLLSPPPRVIFATVTNPFFRRVGHCGSSGSGSDALNLPRATTDVMSANTLLVLVLAISTAYELCDDAVSAASCESYSSALLQQTLEHSRGISSEDPQVTKLHQPAEPAQVGDAVSQELGTDLLGDSLEPTQNGHGPKDGDTQAHAHADGYVVLLMFFGSLTLGALLMLFLDRFAPAVPYTVAMFLSGVVFACWHFSRSPTSTISWHTWFRSVEKWESINPHLLFYCFLPPLIFSEAMKLNVRLVQKCFTQVFLLACPGVLLGTGLVAAVAKYLLPYNWSWAVSLTFGAVLSATDPVAVVALFSTLGVSPKLTIPMKNTSDRCGTPLRGEGYPIEPSMDLPVPAERGAMESPESLRNYMEEQFAKQTKLLQDGCARHGESNQRRDAVFRDWRGRDSSRYLWQIHRVSPGPGGRCGGDVDRSCFLGASADLLDENGELDQHKKQAVKMTKQLTLPSASFEEVKHRNLAEKIVSSNVFSNGVQLLIMINLIILGVEVDYAANLQPGTEPPIFEVTNQIIVVLFLMELLLKWGAYGCGNFFCGRERLWNIFDFDARPYPQIVIVGLSLAETGMELLFEAFFNAGEMNSSHLRVMRFARLARALRGVRVIRLLRYIGSLRTIVFSIVSTMSSLLWTLVLLVMNIYCFGVFITQLVTDHCRYQDDPAECPNSLTKYWASVGDSMLTLYLSITGGLSWEAALRPLQEVNPLAVISMLVYITITIFAVLNVVTGVFCNTAIESARADKDFLNLLDGASALQSKKLASFMHSMDISTQDIWTLFMVIDANGDGQVTLDEFVFGCMQLEGPAKGLQMARMSYENTMMRDSRAAERSDMQAMKVILKQPRVRSRMQLREFLDLQSAEAGKTVVSALRCEAFSKRLVSGESLMNDGTAIVVFVLMLKAVLGASLDATSVLTFFGHMSFSSIIFGSLIGLAAVAIIGKCAEERFHSDPLIQVMITLCCAYLSFFLGESELATSGVLATVSAGFMVAYFAWPRFVSTEAIEIVWETVEFTGNTVIFFLAGLLFADTLLDSVGIIQAADFGWLLMLYVSLLLIRSIMLAVLWIPLQMVGSPIDWREGIAMIWSGLRGAVSLTLAIIIDEEPAVSREMGARIMFHVGGIAALTLLVNATTAAPLLRYLGLARSSGAEQRKLQVLTKHLAQHTQEIKGHRDQQDLRFKGINEAVLQAMVPSLKPSVSPQASDDSSSETLQAYREAFLQVVKSHYWSSIHQGLVPRTSQSARLLLSSVDMALENAAETLGTQPEEGRYGHGPQGAEWHLAGLSRALRGFPFQKGATDSFDIAQVSSPADALSVDWLLLARELRLCSQRRPHFLTADMVGRLHFSLTQMAPAFQVAVLFSDALEQTISTSLPEEQGGTSWKMVARTNNTLVASVVGVCRFLQSAVGTPQSEISSNTILRPRRQGLLIGGAATENEQEKKWSTLPESDQDLFKALLLSCLGTAENVGKVLRQAWVETWTGWSELETQQPDQCHDCLKRFLRIAEANAFQEPNTDETRLRHLISQGYEVLPASAHGANNCLIDSLILGLCNVGLLPNHLLQATNLQERSTLAKMCRKYLEQAVGTRVAQEQNGYFPYLDAHRDAPHIVSFLLQKFQTPSPKSLLITVHDRFPEVLASSPH
eukprot:s774_g9.t3